MHSNSGLVLFRALPLSKLTKTHLDITKSIIYQKLLVSKNAGKFSPEPFCGYNSLWTFPLFAETGNRSRALHIRNRTNSSTEQGMTFQAIEHVSSDEWNIWLLKLECVIHSDSLFGLAQSCTSCKIRILLLVRFSLPPDQIETEARTPPPPPNLHAAQEMASSNNCQVQVHLNTLTWFATALLERICTTDGLRHTEVH